MGGRSHRFHPYGYHYGGFGHRYHHKYKHFYPRTRIFLGAPFFSFGFYDRPYYYHSPYRYYNYNRYPLFYDPWYLDYSYPTYYSYSYPSYSYAYPYTYPNSYSYGATTNSEAQATSSFYLLGQTWGQALRNNEISWGELVDRVRLVVLPIQAADREQFRLGFIAGYGENGESAYAEALNDASQSSPQESSGTLQPTPQQTLPAAVSVLEDSESESKGN